MSVVRRKAWYVSKTIWIGIIELILGLSEVITTSTLFMDSQIAAVLLSVVGVLTILLRFLTELPVGISEGVEEVD